MFAYCINNPINSQDPSGFHHVADRGDIGAGIVMGIGLLALAAADTARYTGTTSVPYSAPIRITMFKIRTDVIERLREMEVQRRRRNEDLPLIHPAKRASSGGIRYNNTIALTFEDAVKRVQSGKDVYTPSGEMALLIAAAAGADKFPINKLDSQRDQNKPTYVQHYHPNNAHGKSGHVFFAGTGVRIIDLSVR